MTHDVGAPAHYRQREPARHDLSQCADVWNDAIVLLRAAIREPEPGHDLVEDQRNAAFRSYRAQRLQEPGLRRHQPLEWFHDHRRQFVTVLAYQARGEVRVVERRD